MNKKDLKKRAELTEQQFQLDALNEIHRHPEDEQWLRAHGWEAPKTWDERRRNFKQFLEEWKAQ